MFYIVQKQQSKNTNCYALLVKAKGIAKTKKEAGFDVDPVERDISSRESILNLIAEGQKYGEITALINAAGVSPSQAPIETILKVDLYGTAVLLEEVGKVIAPGGVGVTISSQSGHRILKTQKRGLQKSQVDKWKRKRLGRQDREKLTLVLH